MKWLDPWSPVESTNEAYREKFMRQLATEVSCGHPMYKLPVQLIGRGNSDDCLFAILDGTNRVAVVHLVWQGPQKPPWPDTTIYKKFETWRDEHMLPEHKEWTDE